MKIITVIGDLVIKLFNLVGMLILEIPRLPSRLRNINTSNIKNKVDTEALKENISKIKDEGLGSSISKISKTEISKKYHKEKEEYKDIDISKAILSGKFTSEEKERTILQLQILSGGFLVVSILYIFNFLSSFILYAIIGVGIVAYLLYLLFSKVKLMYSRDFNAYRDFFLMYIAVGIILVLISSNPYFVMAFSFQFLPSLSVLIFAVISVLAIFLIFRIRYHRNYTYGEVIEAGKKTAYVKVDYDICSNVKPDIYLVENSYDAKEGDMVKLQIEEKLLSTSGNKPVSIIETVNHL